MNVRKSDAFIADVERQFEWYVVNANWEIAERYLAAVETTSKLLGQHSLLGPVAGFSHPRLRDWRFMVVARPFQKHILFYESVGEDVVLRRALHGRQDLPQRLEEPPATN